VRDQVSHPYKTTGKIIISSRWLMCLTATFMSSYLSHLNLIAWKMFYYEDNHLLGYDAVWSDRQKHSDISETSGLFEMSLGSYETTWYHILEHRLHLWSLLGEPQMPHVSLHFKCCL
jgi:hypothetical protein